MSKEHKAVKSHQQTMEMFKCPRFAFLVTFFYILFLVLLKSLILDIFSRHLKQIQDVAFPHDLAGDGHPRFC